MNKKIKVLSLFDGMSVAQQALTELGFDIDYYASEIDEYAIAVTQSNHPNTSQLGSVTELNLNTWACLTGGVDLLIGGSPCQDLSIAKKDRKGLDGERSGLFFEYVRIRDEVKPKYFVLENVASMSKESKDKISEILGVQPIMINASLVSAQNRKRLFWVGKFEWVNPAEDTFTYRQVNIEQPGDREILLKDILEEDVPELYFLNKDATLTPSSNKDIAGTLDTGTWAKRFEQIRRVYNTENKSPTLPTGTGGGVITKIAVPVAPNGKKIILSDEPLQVLKEGRTELGKQSRKEIREQTGKDSTYRSKDHKAYFGRDGVKANCLTTGLGMEGTVVEGFQIRKLTPTECLRLQSMPDNYFDKAIYKNKPISNSQRYKMCGNAFNKEVVKHIIKNLC